MQVAALAAAAPFLGGRQLLARDAAEARRGAQRHARSSHLAGEIFQEPFVLELPSRAPGDRAAHEEAPYAVPRGQTRAKALTTAGFCPQAAAGTQDFPCRSSTAA